MHLRYITRAPQCSTPQCITLSGTMHHTEPFSVMAIPLQQLASQLSSPTPNPAQQLTPTDNHCHPSIAHIRTPTGNHCHPTIAHELAYILSWLAWQRNLDYNMQLATLADAGVGGYKLIDARGVQLSQPCTPTSRDCAHECQIHGLT